MATVCFTPILGKRIRVTRIEADGTLPAAASPDAFLATDGFVSVNISAEVEDGAEIITRKADGSFCVNEKQANSLKRLNLEIEFCGVNPSLKAMVSNAETYEGYTADEIIGITVAEGTITKQFAFELWTGLAGETGNVNASGYLLLPLVNAGILGDLTVDGENAISFTLTGAYTKGGNTWGVGPYDVLVGLLDAPSPLPTALDPLDHLLLVTTSLAAPADACDPQPMPA